MSCKDCQLFEGECKKEYKLDGRRCNNFLETVKLSRKGKIVSFFAGMLFMMVFGIIDNGFLIVGMDMNPFLSPAENPILSGMIGNTFSDVIGAIVGVLVSVLFKRLFAVKPSSHMLIEIAGVKLSVSTFEDDLRYMNDYTNFRHQCGLLVEKNKNIRNERKINKNT